MGEMLRAQTHLGSRFVHGIALVAALRREALHRGPCGVPVPQRVTCAPHGFVLLRGQSLQG